MVVRLVSDTPIPEAVRVEEIQLARGDVAWSPAAPEVRPAEGSMMEIVLRDGPGEWVPGDAVDVVAKVTDGDQSSFVRAPRFVIARVD